MLLRLNLCVVAVAALTIAAVVTNPTNAAVPTLPAFFVAVQGSDGWSGRLPAPNAAGTDGPFATLAAAQAALRSTSKTRRIYVRQGSYFMTAALLIGQEDAGEQIMTYPGEHATLYGGLRVQAWHSDGDVFVASTRTNVNVGDGLPIVISNEAIMPMARYPAGANDDQEAAWLFAGSGPDNIDTHNSFRIRPSDTRALLAAQPGTIITVFGHRGWQDYIFPLRQIDAASGAVTLAGSTWDAIGEGSRFALLNAATTPGTWRFDPLSNRLQLRPMNATAQPPADVVAATLPCIVLIDGGREISIEGLRLVGSATEGAAICLTQTLGVTLDRLYIANTGEGIRLDHATRSTITGSEIVATAGFGITLRHGSDSAVIRGNWLHDIGWLHQDASAIWFDGSSHERVEQNRIDNVAKFAIGGGSLTDGGAYDNLIAGNEIDRANQRTSDGGAILVIGWAQDATHDVIRGNLVTHTSALGNIGWDLKPHTRFQDPVTRLVSEAIYLDDWASDVTVEGNLLCGNIGGIELHAGWNNKVTSNVLIGNTGIAIGVDAEEWLGRGEHPHLMELNAIEHNAVVLDRPSAGQTGGTAVRGGPDVAHFNYNIYAGPGLNNYSFHHGADQFQTAYSFGIDAWRLRGQDIDADVGVASAKVVLTGGSLQVIGTRARATLSLADVGRPEDRTGLLERVRQRCRLP